MLGGGRCHRRSHARLNRPEKTGDHKHRDKADLHDREDGVQRIAGAQAGKLRGERDDDHNGRDQIQVERSREQLIGVLREQKSDHGDGKKVAGENRDHRHEVAGGAAEGAAGELNAASRAGNHRAEFGEREAAANGEYTADDPCGENVLRTTDLRAKLAGERKNAAADHRGDNDADGADRPDDAKMLGISRRCAVFRFH